MRKIFFAVALLFFGNLQATHFDTVSLLETIDGYVISLREKKYPKAYYEYTSRLFREKMSPRQFVDFIRRFKPLNENRGIRLGKVAFNRNRAVYHGILTAAGGEELLGEFQLLKEAKCWRIVNLTVYSL